jgi:hypothetical protein
MLIEQTKLKLFNKILGQITSFPFGLRFGQSFGIFQFPVMVKEVGIRCVNVDKTILNAKGAFKLLS